MVSRAFQRVPENFRDVPGVFRRLCECSMGFQGCPRVIFSAGFRRFQTRSRDFKRGFRGVIRSFRSVLGSFRASLGRSGIILGHSKGFMNVSTCSSGVQERSRGFEAVCLRDSGDLRGIPGDPCGFRYIWWCSSEFQVRSMGFKEVSEGFQGV